MSRPAIHAYLTETAYKKWRDYADRHGVTVSALIEAQAHQLNNDNEPLITAARNVDVNRRRRGN